jgi:RNA-directed DNA polymerase
MIKKEMTKSLPISKRMVWDSYQKVAANKGGAGIDRETIEQFNENKSKNLYKIWNRLTSGSYFPPPVRTVLIPKKQGGKRPLGIPTVGDRIAQGVVKDHIEPFMEAIFHPSSFGYRPGRSAQEALAQCQKNCIQYSWVIDLDIKGFFDNISHEKMMQMLAYHQPGKWVLLYVERWLKAGVEQEEGSIVARTKGTPQGGVISPVLANLYLHHTFDKWMDKKHSQNPFERYADDLVIHCKSKEESEDLLQQLSARMEEFSLCLHPEKTKIVYCKNYQRQEKHEHESFTFLGYSFQPRAIRDRFSRPKKVLFFSPSISQMAKKHIREQIRRVLSPQWTTQKLEWFAETLNPKIRGWINYYTKFGKDEALSVFYYLNGLIKQWISRTYKITSKKRRYDKYKQIQMQNQGLFYHWQLGIKS